MTYVNKLVDALGSADGDGVWLDDSGGYLCVDGTWHKEELEDTLELAFAHKPDPEDLIVKLRRHDPDALFLREGLVRGEAEDGTVVELEQAFTTLLFRMTKPDGTVILDSINMGDLLQKWAAKVDSE